MMRVIRFFAFHLFHREVARHSCARRADDWIKIRTRRIVEMVFGEQLAVDLDTQEFFFLDRKSVV